MAAQRNRVQTGVATFQPAGFRLAALGRMIENDPLLFVRNL